MRACGAPKNRVGEKKKNVCSVKNDRRGVLSLFMQEMLATRKPSSWALMLAAACMFSAASAQYSQISAPPMTPGCSPSFPYLVPGTSTCVKHSCASYYDTVTGKRIISELACTCVNSNDCFYSYREATLTPVCSGGNPSRSTTGTCITGAIVPPIPMQVAITPYVDPGCSGSSSCNTGSGSCFRGTETVRRGCGSVQS